VTRDGLPRAYLRMNPNLDQHADPLTMLRLMCAGARQPERGRFKARSVVDRAVGRTKAAAAITRGDLVPTDDGGLYLVGWDEWQEGDLTVAERMRRVRDRRKRKRDGNVTPAPSHNRVGVTTDALVTTTSSSSAGVDVDDSPPPPVKRGRRKDGTSPRQLKEEPRATGDNPRANGTSPRQIRQAEKHGGAERLGDIMRMTAAREPA
jgi:hypothetical protein